MLYDMIAHMHLLANSRFYDAIWVKIQSSSRLRVLRISRLRVSWQKSRYFLSSSPHVVEMGVVYFVDVKFIMFVVYNIIALYVYSVRVVLNDPHVCGL